MTITTSWSPIRYWIISTIFVAHRARNHIFFMSLLIMMEYLELLLCIFYFLIISVSCLYSYSWLIIIDTCQNALNASSLLLKCVGFKNEFVVFWLQDALKNCYIFVFNFLPSKGCLLYLVHIITVGLDLDTEISSVPCLHRGLWANLTW